MNKLSEGRGNLIRQVELLRKLKVPTKKQLPPDLLDAAHVDAADDGADSIFALAAEAEESVEAE